MRVLCACVCECVPASISVCECERNRRGQIGWPLTRQPLVDRFVFVCVESFDVFAV